MKHLFTFCFLLFSAFVFSQNYENQWNEVYRYELNKHYKTANEEVLNIYHQAVADRNDREIVKTFFYRNKFRSYLEITDSEKVIQDIDQEINRVNEPYKSILRTYRAKILSEYLAQKYYLVRELDKIEESYDKTNITEWRTEDFMNEIERLYQAVFSNEMLLKNSNEFLGDLIETDENADLTYYKAYELLCYEWITIFENNQWQDTNVSEQVFIQADEVLDFTNQFTKYEFPEPFSKVLSLYQKLETYYQSQNDKFKLDQIRLKRYQNFSESLKLPFENKDQLLTDIFEAMQTRKFQSKVIVEKVYLWYNYGQAQLGGQNKSEAQRAWTKTVEYILTLKKYELTDKETDYIDKIYETITGKKTATNFPKYLLKNTTDKGLVRLANTDTLYTRFYQVENINVWESLKNDSLKAEFIKHKKPIYEKNIAPLNKEADHFEKEFEFLIDGMKKGIYLVLTSPNQHFDSEQKYFNFHDVIVTDLVLFNKAEAKSVDFYFLDRKTGKPFVNHRVKINGKKYKTNDLGIVSVKKSKRIVEEDQVEETEFLVQFQDEDFLVEGICDFDEEELVYNYQNKDRWYDEKELIGNFFTDRILYRPGQTIYFKGVVVEKDDEAQMKKVISDTRFLVTATDNNHVELFKKEFVTNAFGSFSDSLVIPQKGNLSRVNLIFEEPDNQTKQENVFWEEYDGISGEKTLYVEEYKRPSFFVTFDEFKEDVAYGQEITLTGKALTYAKTPVSDAKVETKIDFSIQHTAGGYSRNKSGTYPMQETTTGSDGSFSVTFQLKDVPKDSLHFRPEFYYRIKTDVKDASGEVKNAYQMVNVYHNDLKAGCYVKSRKISIDDDVEIWVESINANGKFKPVSGTLEIKRTYLDDNQYRKERLWQAPQNQLISKADFQQYFPYEDYVNADTKNQESEIVYSEKIQITEEDKPHVIEKPDWLLAGNYKIGFIPDEQFEEDSSVAYLEVTDPNGIPKKGEVVALSLEDSKIENDSLSVKVNAVFDDVLVFVQVQQNYDILPKTSFVSKKGISEITLPLLKDKNVNEVFIHYYYVYDNRAYEETIERPFYQYVTEPAQTEIIHLKNRLLPGTKEQILLKVNDDNQQPFVGEMLSSMYDLSAESLMNDKGYTNDWRLYTGYSSYREEFSYLYFDPAINNQRAHRQNWTTNLNRQLNITFPKINDFGMDLFGQRYESSKRRYYNKLKNRLIYAERKDGTIELSGQVLDADFGDPIPGATVIIESLQVGTETDMDGEFILFAQPEDIVKIKFPGFEDVVFLAKDFKNPVMLYESGNEETLNELVITSYSLSVTSKTIEGRPNASFIETLQAQVPGLNITTGSGTPGANTSLILRGLGSISGDVQPLYVIDGVPVSAEHFRSLSQEDISNISVMKDNDAIAIYGNRGANGVVLISTNKTNLSDMSDVKIRKNLKETAFFYPMIYPDKNNVYEINYTVPESLSEWKFRALTHNKKAEVSYLETSVYTQKDVTIQPNMPRFLRENDEVILRARVSNVSEEPQQGKVSLQLKDALTEKVMDTIIVSENLQNVTIAPNASVAVEWKVNVLQNIQGLQYVVAVKTNEYSDGEQAIIPVLSMKQFVSENVPVWQLGNTTKQYNLTELNDDEKFHLNYTIQASANGLWLMMKKLPYLLSYEYECTEQLMSKYFANQLALKIVEENKDIQTILSKWKKTDGTKWDNDEQLREIIDKESPWLQKLLTESEQNRKFADYFDNDKLKKSSEELLLKINARQTKNGGLGWFSGDKDDFRITLQILQTVKQLNELDLHLNEENMIEKAVSYLDKAILENKDLKTVPNQKMVDYLYVRTHFKKQFPLSEESSRKWEKLLEIVEEKWLDADLEFKSKTAIVLQNEGKEDIAQQIMKQLRESSVIDESKGMYWKKGNNRIAFWNTPTEEQSFTIEAFVKNNADKSEIESLRARLINQSNYDNFGSTKATVQAVYAYLLGTEKSSLKNEVSITDRQGRTLQPSDKLLTDSGIYEVVIGKDAITSDLNTIVIDNKGNQTVTGSVSYNYLQDLDKISATNNEEQPFSVQKDYFKEVEGKRVIVDDTAPLKIGDEVWVRIKFSTKENASYVHIKDSRASTFEPVFELSGIRYENGLRYYFKGNDASTNFFIDYLPVGEHTLWYRVKVNNTGVFTDGLTTMQSMYAPQYQAHSKGDVIEVQ